MGENNEVNVEKVQVFHPGTEKMLKDLLLRNQKLFLMLTEQTKLLNDLTVQNRLMEKRVDNVTKTLGTHISISKQNGL